MTTKPLNIKPRPILRLENNCRRTRWHKSGKAGIAQLSLHLPFSANYPQLDLADHGYTKDGNITPGSARPMSGKRWGFLMTKYYISLFMLSLVHGIPRRLKEPPVAMVELPPKGTATRHEVAKKKSAKLLRRKPAKHKSTPDLRLQVCPEDLGKVNAYYAPVPKLPASLIPPTPGHAFPLTATSNKAFEDLGQPFIRSSETAIYFTVDPSWSRSQEDVTMIFL
ncbi:hypothetical protein BD779DRAFT_1466461 [Infundibulicybe gibba]|nr:hypothetical protein BD779DRAFT_1466461 [Infundibulicybe gibba]